MFETAIEVEFGPHEADWALVRWTIVSVAVTAGLGLAAYWNGRQATRLAKAADVRETRSDRRAVVLAVMRCFANLEIVEPYLTKGVRDDDGRRLADSYTDAIAHIAMYTTGDADEILLDWFTAQFDEIKKQGRFSSQAFSKELYLSRLAIKKWDKETLSATQLLDELRSRSSSR